MNGKDLDILEKKIKCLKTCHTTLVNEKTKLEGDIGNYEIHNLFPEINEIGYKIENYKYLKEVVEKLTEKKIDLSKKYPIMPNVSLNIYLWSDKVTFYFSLDNDSWFYENYISSHSGINEWLDETISDLFNLYSGNSEYSYSINTYNLKHFRTKIENEKANSYDNRRYSSTEIADSIETLIKFFTDKKNPTRNAIIEDLKFKFDTLKKLSERSDN